jgi:DNA-binding XRE family transcriptional regulator
MYPMICTKNYINLVIGGKSRTVEASNKFFGQLLEAIRTQDWEAVDTFSDLAQTINKAGAGKVMVEDGVVMYDGMPVHNVVSDRILSMLAEGWNIDPMISFLQNLMSNPWKQAIDELYLFMEANQLPITTDGHFLAYKVVTNDFKDKQTRSFDNSVGAVLDMLRDDCDSDRNRTCSTGFHFCGFSYLSHFGSADDNIMIVKVNPADVTSIPSDYRNAKGRACHYSIHGHYGLFSDSFQVDRLAENSVDDWDDEELETEDCDACGTDECKCCDEGFDCWTVVGNPIKFLREKLGYSQRQVAEFANLNKSTLWNAENGNPKPETIEKWIAAMSDLVATDGDSYSYSLSEDGTKILVTK